MRSLAISSLLATLATSKVLAASLPVALVLNLAAAVSLLDLAATHEARHSVSTATIERLWLDARTSDTRNHLLRWLDELRGREQQARIALWILGLTGLVTAGWLLTRWALWFIRQAGKAWRNK